jgi:hypothetical protein
MCCQETRRKEYRIQETGDRIRDKNKEDRTQKTGYRI